MSFQIPWNVKKSESWRNGRILIQIEEVQMAGIMGANDDYRVPHQEQRPIFLPLPTRTILSYDVPSRALNPNPNLNHKSSNLSLVSFIDQDRVRQTHLGRVQRLGQWER